MSVKNFKFVSPGVFINEIDNSFRPRNPDTIGPCVIGRAERGIAMTPVKVESYSQFVEMFGDTVAGSGGGDIYRDGNYQSPMYGTFAAKAFLRSNVAPLTYVRLLGHQNDNNDGTDAAKAGWKTQNSSIGIGEGGTAGGGAYGLWIMKSSSLAGYTATDASSGDLADGTTGTIADACLAAVWYADAGIFELSGNILSAEASVPMPQQGMGVAIESDSNGRFTVVRTDGAGTQHKTVFSLNDNDQRYIRKVFSTNPQLDKSGSFYPESSELDYWLGETYDQEVRDITNNAPAQKLHGWITGLALSSSVTTSPSQMLGVQCREARTSWFIGQDMGAAASFEPHTAQKLFRFIGRGHGEWINKNLKVSIENIRKSNNSTTEYGTFSVVFRMLSDTDSNVQVVERFDKCSLNPASPDFIGRKIGDQYYAWSESERRLKLYGEYPNQSKYVYIDINSDVEAGAAGLEALLPFGYYGPPKMKDPRLLITGAVGPAAGINSALHISSSVYMKISGSTGTTTGASAGAYPFVAGGEGSAAAATATITVADTFPFMDNLSNIVLTAADGTAFTLQARNSTDTSSDGVIGQSDAGSAAIFAQRIAQAVNATCDSKITATPTDASSTTITLTQATAGTAGNKAITTTNTDASTTIAAAFAGGTALPTLGETIFAISGALKGADKGLRVNCRMPDIRLRLSASDGGLSDPTRAYFGIDTGRTSGSAAFDISTKMVNRVISADGAIDDNSTANVTGIDGYGYIFTMDDLVNNSGIAFYQSGSRKLGTSYTATADDYNALLELGYDSFTAPFWGGFDGFNIRLPDPMYNNGMGDGSTDRKSMIFNSIKRAIDTVADPEFVDVNMIVQPGLTNAQLTEHIVNVCEDRADAMTIIDLPNVYLPPHEERKDTKAGRIATTPKQAATALANRRIDSSYGATFYPWVNTRDEVSGQNLWIPPSVAMMGVLASSERRSQLWFAPAGFNRGGLSEGAAGIPVSNVSERLTSKQRDLLYEANINPIASFPSSGIVVFGQKTLQERQSALDRINVRRLVIFLKKQISLISTRILFEQNVQATWNRFIALVEPFLQNVKSNFGISDYRLILDESTTTPDLVDQNIMYAKIMIKPARAIEFIAIDFVVASTGASFDD